MKDLENQIAEKDKIIKSANSELIQLKDKLNQAQIEFAKLESAMKAKDDEVSFLRGHVAQLSQNIGQISEKLPKALPPSEEEAKAKHWYQFWK
jgi:chromosome segregation ATPase